MNWCFAVINDKLAEIYFERSGQEIKFLGHCYVKKAEYKDKSELRQIEKDIAKHRFVYKKNQYIHLK